MVTTRVTADGTVAVRLLDVERSSATESFGNAAPLYSIIETLEEIGDSEIENCAGGVLRMTIFCARKGCDTDMLVLIGAVSEN